jgi:hypothetical protein
MFLAQTMSRSVLDRLAIRAGFVAPLLAVALVAPLDVAFARNGGGSGNHGSSSATRSHIATLPVKQPISHPIVINGPKPVLGAKPVLSKRERKREAKLLRKLERCVEHGGCRGVVIQPIGSPKPLPPYPVSFPIGAKPPTGTGSGGTGVGTNGGYPIGGGTGGTGTGMGAGGTGGTSGGGTPVNAPPTKPPVLSDPGYGAPPKGSGGGGPAGGSASPIDNGGSTIKQF